MSLIGPAGVTVSFGANSTLGTFTGDMSALNIQPGMELFVGSRNGRKGDGQILLSFTPTGSTGGTCTVAEAFSSGAVTAQPFVIDNFAAPTSVAAQNNLSLSILLNALRKFWGLSTTLDQASKTFQRDRAAGTGTFFQDLWSLAGRSWFGLEQRTISGVERLLTRTYVDGTTATESLDVDGSTGGVKQLVAEGAVASAATCDISVPRTERVYITGTSTITSFGSAKLQYVWLRFAGILTLTHSAALALPRNLNIVTGAGDCALAVSDAAGNWRILTYQRFDGKPLQVPTTVQATGGTETALSTSAEFRLSADFLATGPAALILARCAFETAAAATCTLTVEVYDVSASTLVGTYGQITCNHPGGGYQAPLELPIAIAGLTSGHTYRVWIKPAIADAGTVYPRQMIISAICP